MKVVFLDMDGVLVTRLPGVAESKLVRPVGSPHAEPARVFGGKERQRAVHSAPRHVALVSHAHVPCSVPLSRALL